MRLLCVAILLIPMTTSGQIVPASPCLIVKHATTSHQIFVSGANWQYVAGDFPKGMKWKSNITDRNIRKIKELGGKVVVLQTTYSSSDLEEAKKTCEVQH